MSEAQIKHITTPLTADVIKTLHAGDVVRITGPVYTARDAAHKRMTEALAEGKPLPFDIKGQVVYYVGPSPTKPGEVVGSAGPTTSGRMDKYTPTLIAEGMRGAVTGTAYGATCRGANLPDIEVCGKTGTAENPHGKDHSIFMGFAPYNKPKVAIAVFVENAGFGATYAVPIGRLMIEKYLRGKILPESQAIEDYIVNAVILPNAL